MNTKNIIIGILVIIVLAFLARYVFFKTQFEQWGQGVERVGEWQQNYRAEHPNATDAEMDAAFKSGIANITIWKEKYKQDHPGATDADADAALDAAWKTN